MHQDGQLSRPKAAEKLPDYFFFIVIEVFQLEQCIKIKYESCEQLPSAIGKWKLKTNIKNFKMKKINFALLCLSVSFAFAQNPVSYPKDTAISKPELNFEVLWHTFEDNYAFFKLRNIDWHAAYQKYRPLINANTSDDSLYTVFLRCWLLFMTIISMLSFRG